MSLTKYSFLTVFCYGLAFFLPTLFIGQDGGAFATTVSYIIGAIVLIYLYSKQTEKLPFEKTPVSRAQMILWGLGGVIIAMILQGVAANIEAMIGIDGPSENTQNIIQIIVHRPFFAIVAMIGGPIMEEFVFRRAIMGFFDLYMGIIPAALLSSLAFAFAHNDNQILVYLFLGCFFSWLYVHTGKIWTSIITHCAMNGLVVIVQLALYYEYIQLPV